MISIKKMGVGLLTASLLVTATLLAQAYGKNVHADNTLTSNNEIISVKTTDGQMPDMPVSLRNLSGDGNVIMFSSKATNLPDNGLNGSSANSLYAYNIKTDTTTRVDISDSGVLPNDNVGESHISENGRYVYFLSYATNLIDGKTQYPAQTYIRDLQEGTIIAVSNHRWAGLSDNIDHALGISNDGDFVLLGTRYVGVGYPNFYNAMVGDRRSGSFAWTSIGSNGAYSVYTEMYAGGLSCDGSFAIYQSSGDGIYLVDLRSNSDPDAVRLGTGTIVSSGGSISCNGNYIIYNTKNRTDVTPTPPGAGIGYHTVLYNRITGERKYIDTDSTGIFNSNNPITVFSILDTGDAFVKQNGNMYIKHINDGSNTLESIAKATSGTYIDVPYGHISRDGRYALFMADPYDLGMATSPEGLQIIRTRTNL